VGNHRIDQTYANQTLKVGGHYDVTVNGKLDTKAGEHIKSVTKLYQIDAGDRFVAKSAGGTIIIDGGGITLKGNVTIKGNVAISGGSPEAVKKWSASANSGDDICWGCLLKELMGES
jgi:type VI secretion system secreted protein VgrG